MSLVEKQERFRRRMQLTRATRQALEALDYEEVDTPLLVRAPGMEPAIQAFETRFVPELGDADLALARWWTAPDGDFAVSLAFKE